jgi:hypothetical protein
MKVAFLCLDVNKQSGQFANDIVIKQNINSLMLNLSLFRSETEQVAAD